ncbi:MAG: hypothetical protein AAF572_24685 [Cyanobacteria bacterium P01_B01_bin.77]
MNDTAKNAYLDRILKVYEDKYKKFRLSLTLLLIGTTVFFFLIFYPYMTIIGNLQDCELNQSQCPTDSKIIKERIEELTTNWGKIPVSTAEVVIFFPVATTGGFAAVTSQLQELVRLRQALAREVKTLANPIDITLIAPLLIDPKRNRLDQIAGVMTLCFPFFIFLYSVRLILFRIEIIRSELPYRQSEEFYFLIYFVSAFLFIYSLVKTGSNTFRKELE